MEIEWKWIAWHRKKKISASLNVDRDFYLKSFYVHFIRYVSKHSRELINGSLLLYSPLIHQLTRSEFCRRENVKVEGSLSFRVDFLSQIRHKTGKRLNHEPSEFQIAQCSLMTINLSSA